MSILNLREKQYSNHQNIDCKDVKIGLFEYSASTLFPEIKVNNVLNFTCEDRLDPNHVVDDNHPYRAGSFIRDMVGDNCTINFYPQNDDGVKRAILDGVNLVSFSGGNMFASDDLEKKLAQQAYLMVSAGNEGRNGENITPRNDWWCAVGAYHYDEADGIPDIAYYSSYGFGKVKTCSFSNMQYKVGSSVLMGTSFSCPFSVGLVAQFMQVYYNKFGFMPTPLEVNDFVVENSKPIINDKLREGNGLLILPNLLSEYQFGISMIINNKEINVNGVKEIVDVPPMLVENRTMLPVNLLRKIGKNNGKVYWDGKNNRVVVR